MKSLDNRPLLGMILGLAAAFAVMLVERLI